MNGAFPIARAPREAFPRLRGREKVGRPAGVNEEGRQRGRQAVVCRATPYPGQGNRSLLENSSGVVEGPFHFPRGRAVGAGERAAACLAGRMEGVCNARPESRAECNPITRD